MSISELASKLNNATEIKCNISLADEDNIKIVREIIKEMAKDKLFIVVTHNEEDIKLLNAQKVLL